MGCFKNLTIAASNADQFTPLHMAVYVPSSGEILGTMENYIARFNGTTGAYMNQVRAMAPMYGPMHIALVNGVPWISAWNDKYLLGSAAHPQRDLFQVNPITLAIGAPLGIDPIYGGAFWVHQWVGPRMFVSVGTNVYILYRRDASTELAYMDTTNTANTASSPCTGKAWCEQLATNGTSIFTCDPNSPEITYFDLVTNQVDYSNTPSYTPVGVEWVAAGINKAYAVCGDKWLIRVDAFPTSSNTYIDLDALSGQVGVQPIRLRFNSVDNLVYIPVQNKDGIIVYDPVGATAVWKSGFDSPIDVVFTPTKKFAVQSGLIGLKEIL